MGRVVGLVPRFPLSLRPLSLGPFVKRIKLKKNSQMIWGDGLVSLQSLMVYSMPSDL